MCREVTRAVQGSAATPAGPHTSASVSCKNTLPNSQHLPCAQLATGFHPHTAQPTVIKARTAQRPHRKRIPSNSQIPCPFASFKYRHRAWDCSRGSCNTDIWGFKDFLSQSFQGRAAEGLMLPMAPNSSLHVFLPV